MIIFDLNHSPEDLALKLQSELSTLRNLAKLSLLESQDDKGRYLSDCLELISNLNFDSIKGGCYQQKNHSVELSLAKNCLLAEFLLAAGFTFFNGELSYLANTIISATTTHLYSFEKKLFNSQLKYQISTAPFIFYGKTLQEILTDEEQSLLNALLLNSEFDKNIAYWVSYKSTIKSAAEKVNLHFKQSQILEHSIRLKLIDYQNKYPSIAQLSNEFYLSENAKMLSILVQSIIWSKKNETTRIAAELNKSLVFIIKSRPKISDNETIDICFALLDYAQIVFDQRLTDILVTKILNLNNVAVLSNSYRTRLTLVCSYLNQIQTNLAIDSFLSLHQLAEFKSEINLVKLTGSGLQQEKIREDLLACYDPFLRLIQLN